MSVPYVGYGRVSRIGDRAERLRSLDFQEADIRSAAAARELEVLRVITDPDESGANAERRGLLEAIALVESGAGGIIVAKLDRFSRDVRQAWAFAERIHNAGGRIISFAESSEWTTPEGELQVGIVLQFAQYERKLKRASFERSKAAAVARGVPVSPRVAPGLRLVRDEHGNRAGVEHDERVAPVIREVFELRAAGAGPSEVAEVLERAGVRTSMGSRSWSKPAVYSLLSNRAYLGELRQGEHLNPRAWEPVVDRAVWEAAQHPNGRRLGRARPEAQLLVGLVRCFECRHALQATTSARGRRVYRCTVRHAGGRCAAPARAYVEELDDVVLGAFWGLVRDFHARGTERVEEPLDELRGAVERTERALTLYRDDEDLEATVEALGGMAAWRDGLRVRNERAEFARRRLVEAERRIARAGGVPRLSSLRRDWPSMGVQARREAIASVIDVVALRPRSSGLAIAERVVVFAAGYGPLDLPRRGFRERPGLRAFDLPAGAGMGGLKPAGVDVAEAPARDVVELADDRGAAHAPASPAAA